MKNKSTVLISIKNIDEYYLIRTLSDNNIFYSNFSVEKKLIFLNIKYIDFNTIRSLLGKKNVKIRKYYGKKGFIKFFSKHYIFLICSIWGYLMILILSNTIFKIEVVTTDTKMAKLILKELDYNGIKKYKFKKSYEKLNEIKNNILISNKDKLEWLEIETVGTKYIVNFTSRIIPEESKIDNTPQNIVSKKDAIIMHIESSSGEVIREINDYVRRKDVIISGNIMRNEETLVTQVKATGKVYGEVWYVVNTTVPYKYVEYKPTGKIINHYYIDIFGKKMTLLGKYDTKYTINEKSVIVDKPYLFFKIIKEKKEIYEYKEFKVTKKEALEEAINRSIKSIEVKLDKEEYIIDKKVLKIEEYSSKISIEVFFKVYENITDTSDLGRINEEIVE